MRRDDHTHPDTRRQGGAARGRVVWGAVALLLLGGLGGGAVLWRARAVTEMALRTILLPTQHAAAWVAVDERVGRAVVTGMGPDITILATESARIVGVTVIPGLAGNRFSGPAVISIRTGHTFVVGAAASGGTGSTSMSLISMLDTRTGALVRTIAASSLPGLLAVDEQRDHLLMVSPGLMKADGASLGPGSVSILDARGGALLRHVVVSGLNPFKVAVDASTARIFAVNYTSNTVSILDARSGALLDTVMAGRHPYAIAVAETAGRVFIANQEPRGVSMLDARTGKVLRTLGLGFAAAVAVDAQAGRIIVAHSAPSRAVSVLDAVSGGVVATVEVGGSPATVAVDARTHHAFLTGTGTNTSIWLQHLGQGRLPWVGNDEDHYLTVLDTRTGRILHKIPAAPTGGGGVAVDDQVGHAFAVDYANDSVLMLDAAR